ncbi:hypothetical protein Glove_350g89 [Diversispora epigaea]|uniref:Uncharacterized protein n=1 Tax=Diversispora epigaea TaxID=1348612 RepID=A0A397HFR7_9GLOM|nr:hypothetical protein Glove_350g89 [Diversispora epigaea]
MEYYGIFENILYQSRLRSSPIKMYYRDSIYEKTPDCNYCTSKHQILTNKISYDSPLLAGYFWQLKHLLRNVLDHKSASSTTAQLQRKRNYSDEIQRYDFPPPAKAPNWACNEQEDVVYDTEFVQTEEEDESSFASTSSSKISAEQE